MTYPPPPYADAVCGTFVCGEAICGTWWAYPATAGLALGGNIPTVVLDVEGGAAPPSAGLAFGASLPTIRLYQDATVSVPSAGLAFGATPPATGQSQAVSVSSAGLAFGASIPSFLGRRRLTPIECIEVPLVPGTETELALTAAGSSELALEPEECG